MEYRSDWHDLLMAGLPEIERRHVASVIRETTAAKLRRKRAEREPLIGGDEDESGEP